MKKVTTPLVLIVAAMCPHAAEMVTVRADSIIQEHIAGVGYNMQITHETTGKYEGYHITDEIFQQEIAPRMRDLQAGAVRFFPVPRVKDFELVEGRQDWNHRRIQLTERALDVLKEMPVEVILMGDFRGNPDWLNAGKHFELPAQQAMMDTWARAFADYIEYFSVTKEYSCVKWTHWTNECAQAGTWGFFKNNKAHYVSHSNAVYQELNKRGLLSRIGFYHSDATMIPDGSGIRTVTGWGPDIDYMAQGWGLHYYAKENYVTLHGWSPDKTQWYPDLVKLFQSVTEYTNTTGKPFMIGEFGGGPNLHDILPTPDYGIEASEIAMAAINAGAHSVMTWSLADGNSNNTHGMISQYGGVRNRPYYYALGLMMKHIRYDSRVHAVSTTHPDIRSCAVSAHADGARTVVVLNRKSTTENLSVRFESSAQDGSFDVYRYDPANVPTGRFLQGRSKTVLLAGGTLSDELDGNCMAVYVESLENVKARDHRSMKTPADATRNRPRIIVAPQGYSTGFNYYTLNGKSLRALADVARNTPSTVLLQTPRGR